jgi:hypothetical protein
MELNVKEILNKLSEIFYEHEIIDALEKISSINFFIDEANNVIQLITQYSVDPNKWLGDLIGAIANIYNEIGEMTQIVKYANINDYVKDLIYELKREVWNIVREYLKIKAKQ